MTAWPRLTMAGGAAVILFNAAFLAWLLVRPGGHALFTGVDNVAQFLGPLLLLPLCFKGAVDLRRRSRGAKSTHGTQAVRWYALALIGAGATSYCIGQMVYAYYEVVLRYPTAPFPSWADAGFLACYPFVLAGILLLPARRLSAATRTRLILDGLMIMVAVATFSWYLVLGPTVLQGGTGLFTQAVAGAYPLGDLMLVCCVLFLSARAADARLRVATGVFALGFCIDVVTDSIYDVRQLQGTYHTGGIVDAGWPLAYMLIMLAASISAAIPADRAVPEAREAGSRRLARAISGWQPFVPYAFIPLVGALVIHTWFDQSAGDDALEPGVLIGAVALIGLVLLRQIMALLENRRLLDSLRESEARKGAILAATVDSIITIDHRGRITEFNPAAERMFGYSRVDALGQTLGRLIVPPAHREGHERGLERYVSTGQAHILGKHSEGMAMRRDGTEFPVEFTVTRIADAEPPVFVGYVRDISERKAAEEALRHQALHDALTDLPNRTLLLDRVEQAIRAAQGDRHPLALLLLDLDRFKDVNDTYGHHHGDHLLRQVAERLRGALGADDTIARLGGDEFAVLLPRDGAAGAVAAATAIAGALEAAFIVEERSVHLGCSIGIALYPDHGDDSQTLLRRADVAMYVAKRKGDTHAIYAQEHDAHAPDRLAMVESLRQAIARGGLALHYQPKVDLATGSVAGVEALARWHHPAGGATRPDVFIPLAEQTGLIAPLTRWVLETALRQCRCWLDRGNPLSVAVNLSVTSLLDPLLPDTIAGLLHAHGVSPSWLRIEVTESTLMADPEHTQAILGRLAALGIGISIDDYGTGYSSLAYLKRLPVDEIKIDRSFVRHMAEDEADAAIVASTVGLGHSLGLSVVAEGVEDRRAHGMLTAMGCDVAQGYHLSRPLPADELERWLLDANQDVA